MKLNQEYKDHLDNWIKENTLSVFFKAENVISVQDIEGDFLILSDKDKMLNEDFIQVLDEDEYNIFISEDIKYLLWKFGSFWFYQDKNSEKTEFNFFRYLGYANTNPSEVPFLGLHGKYELCNGSREYKDWIKKLKFLGYTSAGICEFNTLAGTYNFQQACNEYKIKALIGRTSTIRTLSENDYYVKSFCKSRKGWSNLLRLHKIEQIDRHETGKFITEDELLLNSEDLIHIIYTDADLSKINEQILSLKDIYYQIDPSEYLFDYKDKEILLNIENYYKNFKDKLKCVISQDAYYLDKGDHIIKPILNKIINKTFQSTSEDQFLKPYDDILTRILDLTDDLKLIEQGVDNLRSIESQCDFKIERFGTFLPKYKLNQNEAKLFNSSEDLFFSLINDSINEKIIGKVDDENLYIERIENEIKVLSEGNVIDYFLTLWDIVNFAKREGAAWSVGRGSAAGSIISWLLDITRIDPIKYDLLFERFLNKGRIGIAEKKFNELLKIQNLQNNQEIISFELENNEIINLLPNQEICVERNKKQIIILAEEIQVTDDFLLS
jgi:DNA polymerase-3 subunit alpha